MSENTISLKVITPTRILYEGEVTRVLIHGKGENGEFAVYPNHIAMTADVGLGSFEFTEVSGEVMQATLFGGYAVICKNQMVIMAQVSEWPWEIDTERAEAAKKRAEGRLNDPRHSQAKAEAAIYRAVTRLKLYKSR